MSANFIAYLTFTSILAVTPGSTTAVVVRNTLRGGHRAGLATAAGAAVVNCLHALLAGVGLAALLARWPIALLAVRYGGAVFLAVLGVHSCWTALRSSDVGVIPGAVHHGAHKDESLTGGPHQLRTEHQHAFRDGVAINLSNTTIISFYAAIVPTFIPAGAPWWYFAVLAGSHVAIALMFHSMWVVAFHAVRRWFATPGARRALTAGTGLALIYLAARVLR